MKNNKKGQAVVELSLVLPVFILVILVIFDFGRALHMWSSLNHQCVQAARLAAKRTNQLVARNVFLPSTHTPLAEVEKAFWDARSPIMAKENYIGPNWITCGVGTTQQEVSISASYQLQLITPFLNRVSSNRGEDGSIILSASAVEKKE